MWKLGLRPRNSQKKKYINGGFVAVSGGMLGRITFMYVVSNYKSANFADL